MFVCTNLVNGELEGNFATFANTEIQEHDNGECTWENPVYNEVSGKWDVPSVQGVDVTGESFNSGTLTDIPNSERVNPTKVFWWIVGKIKSTLCPECL